MAGPLRRLRRRPSAALAGAWFVVLALLVAGPLLGRGHLILLDFPSGPASPRVSLFPLPSSGELGNTIPLNAAHALLHALWSPLPAKLFLLLPIVVGGLGLFRLVREALGVGLIAAAFGGTLYVINPFVYDRYLSGHMHLLLAYALLPWAVVPLVRALRTPSVSAALVVGLWLGVLAAVSFHVAGLYALLVLVVAAVAVGRVRSRASFAGAVGGIGALLSAYWLLPLFFAPERRVGFTDLAEFESRPDGFRIVPTLLSLYGFWREEFDRPIEIRPVLYLLLVVILTLVALGAASVLRSARDRRLAIALVVAGILGLLLAAGTALPPTAGVFRWLYEHVPFFGAYREPQKFLALTVLAYAVLGGAGLERLRQRGRWSAAGPIAIASVLLYGHAMFWGLSEIELSRYPKSWSEADRVMERTGEGRLIVLPFHLYEDWTFTDSRIVAGPAPSFFRREVLIAQDSGFENVPPASVDPFFYYVTDLLDRDGRRDFGRQIAPLGVRYIAVTSEADPEDFQWLSRQRDLESVYFGGDLALFENRAWEGEVLALSEIREREPYVESVRGTATPLTRRLPGWKSITPPGPAAVSVAERCNDGWRLDDAPARCHLGTVSAFEAPNGSATLWRPFVAVQALGYAITFAALAFIGLALWRRKKRAGGVPGPRIAQRAG